MFNEKFLMENINEMIKNVKQRVYTPICGLNIEIYTSKEPLSFTQKETGRRREVHTGDKWGDLFDCAWFHFTAKLPEAACMKKIVYVIDINGEGLIFDNSGCPLKGITNINSSFDRAMGNPGKRIVQFSEAARGGEKIDFWMDAGCNDLTGNLQENGTIKEAYIAFCDDTARTLFYDMLVLKVQADNTPEEDPMKYEILSHLKSCFYILKDYTREEMDACLEITRKRLSADGGENPSLSLTAFGHAHIDLGWLWPIRETKRKGARTFATALEQMNRYPEYLFGASQPQLYDWIKQDYPELYTKVKKSIKDNRWELLGAVWVEPDANVISGESMVRQIMYGNAFWQKEFGQTTDFIFMPDTFGYPASMPQILKKAGIEYFSTIKMSWNLINDFPYTNFRWRGIDGSEVLVHMPPEGNYLSEGTAKSVSKIKKRLYRNGQFGEALLPYGIGDGGGGPSPCHLEYLRREQNLPGLCSIKQGKMSEFFRRFSERSESFPVYDDELYLERHLGVYTSAARNKKYNRLLELTLRDAEMLSAIAMREEDYSYPKEDFERIWKEVLLYQFHDILPGSSIQRVYDESLARYEILYKEALALKEKAAVSIVKSVNTSGMKKPVVIFNTLSFERNYSIETENGYIPVTLPPIGYKAVDLAESIPCVFEQQSFENEYLSVSFNDDGSINSIYSKELKKNIIKSGSNKLLIYDDTENAWNLQYAYRDQRPETVSVSSQEIKYTSTGVFAIQHYIYKDSTFDLTLALRPGSRVLEVTVDADWQEKHKMLRILFDTNVWSPIVNCEIQYGHITRSTKNNNTYQQAQIEMAAHKWVSLAEPGLNFVLLNDCKYGYSVNDNLIELNALRGTDYPAKSLDFGHHTFRYGIYCDEGNNLTNTVKQGYIFNVPPISVIPTGNNSGTATPERSYITAENPNIMIDSVKKAENSDDIIIRTYEAAGTRTNSGICVHNAKVAELCNLVEDKIDNMNSSCTEYGPFEIISYRVK